MNPNNQYINGYNGQNSPTYAGIQSAFQQANPGRQFTNQDFLAARNAIRGAGQHISNIPNSISNAVGAYSPQTNISNTIDANSLNNTQAFNLPNPIESTTLRSNLGVSANNTINTATNDLAAYEAQRQQSLAQAPKSGTDQIRDEISRLVGIQGTRGDFTNEIQAEQDIANKTKALNNVNNQITLRAKSYDDQIKKIQGNGAITQEQAAIEISALERRKNEELANLGIQKSVALNDFNTAQSLVKDKIAAKFEPIDNQIKNLQNLYNLYQNDLTEKEKLQAQAQIQSQKDTRNRLENAYSTTLGLATKAIQKGAPVSTLAEIDQAFQNNDINGMYQAIAKYNTENTTGALSPYASNLDATIGRTLILLNGKPNKTSFENAIAQARDDADKINAVATVAYKNLSAADRTDYAHQTTAVRNIDKAIKLIDEGAKTGLLQNGAQYTFNLLGKDFDPKLTAIKQYLISAVQPYRNSVTGAAWGAQEEEEYNQLFGSTKYSPAELKDRLERVKEIMKDKSLTALSSVIDPLGSDGQTFILQQPGSNGASPQTVAQPLNNQNSFRIKYNY